MITLNIIMRNQEQILAACTSHSVWVSASAGTGKTKVLTDRVLRLLLDDVPFEKILCLTFTNAAAIEMQTRISDTCFTWRNDVSSLDNILGYKATTKEKRKAQKLFNKLILSPNQLPIYTIHSFCQKILQSFPLEAGLQPGFQVLGQVEAEEIIDRLIEDLLENNNNNAFQYLLSNLHENNFFELLNEILSDQIYFKELFDHFPNVQSYISYISKMVHLGSNDFYQSEFISLVHVLRGKYKDISQYDKIFSDDDKIRTFFLTANDEKRKKLCTKKEALQYPFLEDMLYELQDLVYKTDQKNKKIAMVFATTCVYEVAKLAIEKYQYIKKSRGYLDYDDLIYYTKELLTRKDMKDWVLYKLDGGIMHLLVDEAQDTSPQQWSIVEAIMGEFYSGNTNIEENRTIFIVGDEKQSIYSFQGADLNNFNRFNNHLANQMKAVSKNYLNIQLKLSYRSALSILDFVNKIWADFSNQQSQISKVIPFRKTKGTVEIWPLYKDSNKPQKLFWPLIDEMQVEEGAVKKLANDIAKYIKSYISSGLILESTKEKVKADDFLIIFRRRNELMEEVIKALKDLNIEVGGMDRVVLTDHISIKDLLSVVKYLLLPKDDLNFAELIKSPIFAMNDDELQSILKDESHQFKLLAENLHVFDQDLFGFFYNLIEIYGLRHILVSANGASTNDMLDEFLNLVMQFEKNHSSSIQEFLYWLEKRDIEVKRDPNSIGFVRVMTIHGSKGLESPIVILTDTTSLPGSSNNLLWVDGCFLWLGESKNNNEEYKNLKKSTELAEYQEYLRLLYVALTRAEDHLIVVGHSIKENIPEGCFYDLASKALMSMEYGEDNRGVKRIGDKVQFNIDENLSMLDASAGRLDYREQFQKYAFKNCIQLDNTIDIIPSQSPLYSRVGLNYGQIIHKILEDSVNTKNFTFSPSHPIIQSLPKNVQQEVVDKINKLFLIEEFVDLIKNSILKTEVSICYNDENNMLKIGRIDLMAIKEKQVIIVDYKTDKHVPHSYSEIPQKYIKQLEFYSDVMSKIYPDYHIITKILWVEELKIISV